MVPLLMKYVLIIYHLYIYIYSLLNFTNLGIRHQGMEVR